VLFLYFINNFKTIFLQFNCCECNIFNGGFKTEAVTALSERRLMLAHVFTIAKKTNNPSKRNEKNTLLGW
jgi:hypothetical protein